MTEEYSQRVLEWVELPAAPLPASSSAEVSMKLPKGWSVAAVDVAFEPPPRSLSLAEIRARGSYSYPPSIRTLRPAPPPGGGWGAVKRKNREALATAPTALVRQLEEGLFSALASRGREPVLDVEEAYQRLLLYGIAQFHGIAVERREPAGLRFQRRPREGGAQERLHRLLAAPG